MIVLDPRLENDRLPTRWKNRVSRWTSWSRFDVSTAGNADSNRQASIKNFMLNDEKRAPVLARVDWAG
jgi:hypothetical protein